MKEEYQSVEFDMIEKNHLRELNKKQVFLHTIAQIALLIIGLGPHYAAAQPNENKADIPSYCREQFGVDAFLNIDRRDNGLLCSVRTDGGLRLVHNKIEAADVCAKQHRTRQFRREGQSVVCLRGSEQQSNKAGHTIDLEQHCRENYGPNAFVTTRLGDNKPMCTLRTEGGLGLRHHLIYTNRLCGGTNSIVEKNKLICGSTKRKIASAGSNQNVGSSDSSRSTSPSRAHNPQGTDTKDRPPLLSASTRLEDLRDCGFIASKEDFHEATQSPQGIGGRGWEYMGVSKPCPDLRSGKVIDFLTVCRRDHKADTVVLSSSGIPMCRELSPYPPHAIEDLTSRGLLGTPLSMVCHYAYFGRYPTKEEQMEIMSIVRYFTGDLKVECFYIKRNDLIKLQGAEQEQEYIEVEM